MKRISCSKLPTLMICPVAGVLPVIKGTSDNAKVGSAVHYCLQQRVPNSSTSWENSVASVDAAASKFGLSEIETAVAGKSVRNFKWVPPVGASAELSLAIDVDGNCIVVPPERASPGNYAIDDKYWLAGTLDVAWPSEDGKWWVADYKTGDEAEVKPVEKNPQLLALAYMFGKAMGVETVPAVIFIRDAYPDGLWEFVPPESAADRIAGFEPKLLSLRSKLEQLHKKQEDGDSLLLDAVVGLHCTYCASMLFCPKYLAEVRALLGKFDYIATSGRELTHEELVELVQFNTSIGRIHRMIGQLLKAHVNAVGPIQMGDVTWGPIPGIEDSIVSSRDTWSILEKHLGEQAVWASMKVTKSAVYAACKEAALQRGEKIAAVNRLVMGELKDAGCVQQVPTTEYKLGRVEKQDGEDRDQEAGA